MFLIQLLLPATAGAISGDAAMLALTRAELTERFIRFNEDGINLSSEVELYEKHLIMEALRKANGVTARAAQLLHLNRTTLVEKLKRKGVDPRSNLETLPLWPGPSGPNIDDLST